jgi:hypothetical protein
LKVTSASGIVSGFGGFDGVFPLVGPSEMEVSFGLYTGGVLLPASVVVVKSSDVGSTHNVAGSAVVAISSSSRLYITLRGHVITQKGGITMNNRNLFAMALG